MGTKGRHKTGGRTKGTPNKTTEGMRNWVKMLIEKNMPRLEKDLKALEPKERWAVVEKLMQYTVPKMQSVETTMDFSKMSDEQLNVVINELINNFSDED
jgi:hypothetical protein